MDDDKLKVQKLSGPTWSHRSSIRREFLADVEQTAEQKLFGVLHVTVISCRSLQTPENTQQTHISSALKPQILLGPNYDPELC